MAKPSLDDLYQSSAQTAQANAKPSLDQIFQESSNQNIDNSTQIQLSPETQDTSALGSILSNPAYITGPGAIGEVSRREEAVFANPLVDAIQGKGEASALLSPVNFGGQKSVIDAVTGKRTQQFGDALKFLGADNISAAVGGFAMATMLPSNILLSGAGEGEKLAKQSLDKMVETYARTPNNAKEPLTHLLANFLNKDARRVKQLLDNPEIYSPFNADMRQSNIIANKINRGLEYLKTKAPEVLEPSAELPFNIANKAIEDFNATAKQIGNEWKSVVEPLRKNSEFAILPEDLNKEISGIAKSLNLGRDVTLKGSDAEAAINSFRSLHSSLKDMSKQVVEGGRKFLKLDDLLNLREDLGSKLRGTFGEAGQVYKPGEKETALLKGARKTISDIIHKNFPEIADVDQAYSKVAETRSSLFNNSISKPRQLGNLIKSKVIDPIRQEALDMLDQFVSEPNKVSTNRASYLDNIENSLGKALERIGIKRGDVVSIENQMKNFDQLETPISQQQILKKLDYILPDNAKFWDHLSKHDLARSFSKAGSIFKANATANLGSSITGSKEAGMIAGILATIPPAFARTVKSANALGPLVQKAGNKASKALTSPAGIEALRKLLRG